MFLPFLMVCSALAAQGQPPAPPAAVPTTAESVAAETPSTDTDGDLPVSIERIQRALSRPPAIRLKGDKSVFRVEVLGKRLTIEDILGPDYLTTGPVPRAPITHQDFLDMVTPKDYQGYAAFSNREGAAVAASSFALQWALQKAIHKYQTAHEDRARETARKEVQDALIELEKARVKAGLPPR
jgi:hypothetical protein